MIPALQPLALCAELDLAGGKAANLGRLLRAGFEVPEGFVITTQAELSSADVREQILSAWRELGAEAVAVRSSAPREDGSAASAAGQFDSVLEVRGEEALFAAIEKCRASLRSARAAAYRSVHADPEGPACMAVIVQKFIPAEFAGVLFTIDPQGGDAMRVEAGRGTGEDIVGGRISPEVYCIDRSTGKFTGEVADPCLDERMLRELWTVGQKVAALFGQPQDIEWAIQGGRLFVLQSRPITSSPVAAARTGRLKALTAELRSALSAGGGPWSLHNISESLRHPTALTWSVFERHLSVSGGFGRLYRLAGFEPRESSACPVARCIAGRIYTDLAAAPALFGWKGGQIALHQAGIIAEHQPLPALPAGSLIDRLRTRLLLRSARRRMRSTGETLDRHLDQQIIPAFEIWCRQEKQRDLSALSASGWLDLWRERERRVFDEFAPEVLLATLLSGEAVAALRRFVERHVWDEDPAALVESLISDPSPPEFITDLQRLAQGERALPDWLERWGHRAPDELELASSRWRGQPARVTEMAAALPALGIDQVNDHRLEADATGGFADTRGIGFQPMIQHSRRAEITRFSDRLMVRDARRLEVLAAQARRYLRFREVGRDWTMRGHDLLRDLALEAGRRLEIGDDIFHLIPDETAEALAGGSIPHQLLAARKSQRAIDRTIHLPPFLDEAAIDALGELPPAPVGDAWQGTGISAGTAAGRARIVRDIGPADGSEPGEILVCLTLDPNLTPLLLRAGGLVVETGGALSHAAIVAREMNLPAVVLPGATHFLRDGMRLALDGGSGCVRRNADAATGESDRALPADLVPPPPSRREANACRLRNLLGISWCLLLAAFFLVPRSWLLAPALAALDPVLWPLVLSAGKVGAVALMAVLLAVVGGVAQRLLTDNERLRLAKERATRLKTFDLSAVDRPRADRLIAGVQQRLLSASLVAPAVLLGPLVLTLFWLSHRLDPANANPTPGADFTVLATVESGLRAPVEIDVPPRWWVDPVTPARQSVPPIRETLERLLVEWEATVDPPREKIADLRAYLAGGVPPQTLFWKVTPVSAEEGAFAVAVRPEGGPPLHIDAVFGASAPPAETKVEAKGDIRSVELIHAKPPTPSSFWRPLGGFGVDWDAGWFGVYLVTYLVAGALFRRLFKLA